MSRGRTYFTQCFGFDETDFPSTRQNLLNVAKFSRPDPVVDFINIPSLPVPAERCDMTVYTSPLGDETQVISAGIFYEPSVAELRAEIEELLRDGRVEAILTAKREEVEAHNRGRLISVRNLVGESNKLHSHRQLGNAVFQAASQFNYLEFPGPSVVPENGISGYEHDRTQGPACAIACAAGTAYRNYLVQPLPEWVALGNDQRGQTRPFQRNGLVDVERRLLLTAATEADPGSPTSTGSRLPWIVRNGYIEASPQRLPLMNPVLENSSIRQDCIGLLRVGVQQDVSVVKDGKVVHPVTQVYCSAVSCGYSRCPTASWAPLATLVLDACYEATLLVAVKNNIRALTRPSASSAVLFPPVLLTKVGGGVFGNESDWIQHAIRTAVQSVARYGVPLDVRIVHYGSIESGYEDSVVSRWSI